MTPVITAGAVKTLSPVELTAHRLAELSLTCPEKLLPDVLRTGLAMLQRVAKDPNCTGGLE
jgi:hypothetical protein